MVVVVMMTWSVPLLRTAVEVVQLLRTRGYPGVSVEHAKVVMAFEFARASRTSIAVIHTLVQRYFVQGVLF